MKKQYNLAEGHKNSYLQGKNKSKSPINSFRKTPPTNIFQKTPPKNVSLMGVTFSTKNSAKTLGQPDQIQQKRKAKINRNMTLYMQELCPRSEIDNAEESNNTPLSTKRDYYDEYFSRSLDKVIEVKSRKQANKINNELNEVLIMIKEEKLKIEQKMKILKKSNEYYRRICEGEVVLTEDKETNTIQILDEGEERVFSDAEVQVVQEQLGVQQQQSVQAQLEQKYNQIYQKLCTMLKDMGIDYRQILPQRNYSAVPEKQAQYKGLSDAEIIKIQRFFINKLAKRIYEK